MPTTTSPSSTMPQTTQLVSSSSETDPLLPTQAKQKKPFYRARPLWLVPFAIIASIARGMTLASRVEVYTQLSCLDVLGLPTNFTTSSTPTHAQLQWDGTPLTPLLNATNVGRPEAVITLQFVSDPTFGSRCTADPRVQSGAARLQTMVTITMGFFSALSTGWWGLFGQRRGRTRVLAASAFGMMLTDLTFTLVSTLHPHLVKSGRYLLVISSFLEGTLGGWSTLQAATSAYVSDCTSDGSRSRIFSRFTGTFYLGFAVGPAIGALLMKHAHRLPFVGSSQPITAVFYISTLCSLLNFLLSSFVFPESLTKVAAKRAATNPTEEHHEIPSQGFVKDMFAPLKIFLPARTAHGRDWSLTLLATSLFIAFLSAGLFQIKYLYAQHVFGWNAETLSYYITFVGGARALNLLIVMPLIISLFKGHKTTNKQGKKGKKVSLAEEVSFDLALARASFLLDIISHTLVSFSSTDPTTAAQLFFSGFTVLSSFGSGAHPAIQSLALCVLHSRNKETQAEASSSSTGSLFGALALLQSSGQMILGPLLFGLVYSSTVAAFPKAIFTLAGGLVFVAFTLLLLVRPKTKKERVEPHRGRSRVSKDLSNGSRSNTSV